MTILEFIHKVTSSTSTLVKYIDNFAKMIVLYILVGEILLHFDCFTDPIFIFLLYKREYIEFAIV